MSVNKQSGAVSLFVVIFAMLLISIVTVSFLRLMISDLRQATNNDLSQSAYDSAMAGTEDAKRALLKYQQYCAANPGDCARYAREEVSSDQCNAALINTGVINPSDVGESSGGTTGEIKVQQTDVEGETFAQAYTCVKIQLNTDNVEGEIQNGASKIIPLKAISSDGSNRTFDTVQVSWYSADDLSTPSTNINLPSGAAPFRLNAQSSSGWPTTRPSLMRAQLMQFGPNFSLTDFDYVNGSGESNANTLFLYPTSGGLTTNGFVGRDLRKDTPSGNPRADDQGDTPLPTMCRNNVSSGGYSCQMNLTLPAPIGGDVANRNAYLRLTPFYKATHFEVKLFSSGIQVNFEGVQPKIDSTGRANDLFRRVESRVELTDPSFPYPEAAVDVSTEFCKDFTVTDTQFIPATCTY